MRIVIVQSPFQNAFFFELADALHHAIGANGIDSLTVTEPDAHEVRDDDVFVLLPPHEYVALEGSALVEDPAIAARTIGVSVEQPSEPFFEHNARIAADLAMLFDFSSYAAEAYRSVGVDAQHLRFGHVPAWDRVGQRRDVDTPVLYLGNKSPRRLSTLAEAADVLEAFDARLIVSDHAEPNRVDDPAFYVGDRKRDLLAGTDTLVNVHQHDEAYFEWLRFADATHAGVAVLTETALATSPYVDGVHFATFERHRFAAALDEFMRNDARRRELADAAHARLVELPFATSVVDLLDAATSLLVRPAPDALPARTRDTPFGRLRSAPPAPAHPWHPVRTLRDRLRGSRPADTVVIAPDGTGLRRPVDALADSMRSQGVLFATVVTDGLDEAGEPMLEGVWGWQPWRLLHGAHLGRVMVADARLVAAADEWLDGAVMAEHPHLRVQLFAAAHGVAGGHIAAPVARLAGAIDPHHRLSGELATLASDILAR